VKYENLHKSRRNGDSTGEAKKAEGAREERERISKDKTNGF
jgi:hypothetical protein